MTFLEAAVEILRAAGRPVHVRDITRSVQKQKLLTHEGRAPEETMRQRLEAEAVRPHGVVVCVGEDVYEIAQGAPRQTRVEEAQAPSPEIPPAAPPRRPRRRRGRRKAVGGPGVAPSVETPKELPAPACEQAPVQPAVSPAVSSFFALADAAYEILRSHAAQRAIHYRQITDMALKRKLIAVDLPDAWRAMHVALGADERDRMQKGLRPRFLSVGSGLFTLSNSDLQVGAAEERLALAAAALYEATIKAIANRMELLNVATLEMLVRLLVRRMGMSEAVVTKRGATDVMLQAMSPAGTVSIGIRAGAVDRAFLTMLANASRTAKGLALALCSGAANAQLCEAALAHGIDLRDGEGLARLLCDCGLGVLRSQVPVVYVDTRFFADLGETAAN